MKQLGNDVLNEMKRSFPKHHAVLQYGSFHFKRPEWGMEAVDKGDEADRDMYVFYVEDLVDEAVFCHGDGGCGRIIIYYDAEDFSDKYSIVKDIMDEMVPGYRIVEHRLPNGLGHVSFTLSPRFDEACQQTPKVPDANASS